MWWSVLICCYSPKCIFLLHKPNTGQLDGDLVGIILTTLKSLMVILMSAVPPGMQDLFWFTISLGRKSLNGLYLVFYSKRSFSLLSENWHGDSACYQESLLLIMLLQTGKITSRWSSESIGPMQDIRALKFSWTHDLPINLYSDWKAHSFWLSGTAYLVVSFLPILIEQTAIPTFGSINNSLLNAFPSEVNHNGGH
jgi:hypothetical protein